MSEPAEACPEGSPEVVTPHAFLTDLASRFGVAKGELLALTPSNDPFNSGAPADIRDAEWFAGIYEQLGKPHVHLRDVHYQVVVRGLARHDGRTYEGTAKDWRELQAGSRKARDLGLVSPWAFVDKRTQSDYRYDRARDWPYGERVEGGEVRMGWSEVLVPYWRLSPPSLASILSSLPLQPLTIEVWIEKDSEALNREVLPVAEEFGCRVVVGAGFQSKTAAADLVKRSIDDGRERVVLWLADADAKGESMAIATARHTEFLCNHWLAVHEPETVVPRIVMDRVALTLEQLAGIEAEIGRKIPVTPDEERDEGRVELQALAAFAPGWVAAELERRLDDLHDHDLGDALDAWEDEARTAIRDAWREATTSSREALSTLTAKRDAIVERFDLDALNAELNEIDPERKALEAEIEKTINDFDVDLPDLPEGEVDLDGQDWLLDTERDFEEQLNAYRRQEPVHRRRPPLDLVEPTCELCGEPLPPGRRRHCSEAHRKQAERDRTR